MPNNHNTIIAVVIPCYKVEGQLPQLLAEIGPEIHQIYIVDDACPNQSVKNSVAQIDDPRLKPIYLPKNQGVGGAVIAGITPVEQAILLPTHKELAADYFCQRREAGVINIGGKGSITVDGETFVMSNKDRLYIAKESKEVEFFSEDEAKPAKFYLVSYPAHRVTKTMHVPKSAAKTIELGSQATSNERTIFQSIRPGIVDSCQLVMGITELKPGSVWNTKPPHTHFRRTEIYMYFDIPSDEKVFHLMVFLLITSCNSQSKEITPFETSEGWGYKQDGKIIIQPQFGIASEFTDCGIAAVGDAKNGNYYIDETELLN